MRKIEKKEEQEADISKFVSMIYRFGQIYYDRIINEYHIGCGQQFFLLSISNNPGISQYELTRGSSFDKGTIAKAVKKLQEQGYLRREQDLNDKRIYKLYVTKEAEPIICMTREAILNWREILTKSLTEEEKNLMEHCLGIMADNAVKHIWNEVCSKQE